MGAQAEMDEYTRSSSRAAGEAGRRPADRPDRAPRSPATAHHDELLMMVNA
jgi:hypothetical protein